jgi:Tol biopolymer transport system component
MGHTPKVAWASFACCALVLLLAPHRSLAQADHRLVWRSIHSEHFDLHYHEPLGMLARTLLGQAEAIHAKVGRSLGLSLRQRVSLVLADDDDAANGFANVLPYNAIHLRVVAPDDMSPLADYDDWLNTLLTHEHTHVVHLEQSGGLPRLIQQIFGRIYTPQQWLPGWLVEGLAVVEESEHTTGGRVGSTQFEMYLRLDALEKRILPLDWITFEGEPWPHGNVRYAYGSAFVHFIVERYGTKALGAFVGEYGRRLIPFGINRALKRVTGATFDELYGEFTADLERRAENTRAAIAAQGRVEGIRHTFHGELTRSPRFLDDRSVAYAVADARHPPELRVLSLESESSARVTRVADTAQSAALHGGSEILYSALDFYRGRYAYNELYRSARDGEDRRKLTTGARAREPDVSPDQQRVVFVSHSAGTSHLELADLADVEGTRRVIVRSRELEQVFTPRFSPDGKRIAYGAWARGGYRDLWLLELESGKRTRLTYDRALDRGPVFSPDGETLYFSSDRTGIANLYAYRFSDGSFLQITNVEGGAFQPDVSPDGKRLVYVGYTSKGFDLYTLALADAPERAAPPSFERPAPTAKDAPVPVPSEAYSPLATLYPRAYELSLDEGASGQRVVVTTSGSDVVGFHSYSLRVEHDLDENKRGFGVGYVYGRPRFPFYLNGGVQRGNLDFVVGQHVERAEIRNFQLSVGTSFNFPRPLRSISLRTEYNVARSDVLARTPYDLDPNYPPPAIPRSATDAHLSASFSYSSVQRQAYDISNSYGQRVTFWAAYYEPYLGARTRSVALGGRAEEFVRFDFRESVLAFAYTAEWNRRVSVGGFPAQIAPIIDTLLGSQGVPGDYARLRGFPVRAGDQLHVLQAEYRFLISRINRGLSTLPIFARRVHAAVFSDVGDAFFGRFDPKNVSAGVGAELRLDWAGGLSYGANYTLRLGVAYGLTGGGVLQWYSTLAVPF